MLPTSSTSPETMNRVVLGTALVLFMSSAYRVLVGERKALHDSEETVNRSYRNPPSKEPTWSSVHEITYATSAEMCSQPPPYLKGEQRRMTVRAGALLKLVDIAAGVAARRHAGGPCVTISVDAVLLLKPVYLGELIHLSASVNRAWGTSMEIGVRVSKEEAPDSSTSRSARSKRQYVSHAYLSFVAIHPDAASTSSDKWRAPKANSSVNTSPSPPPIPLPSSSSLPSFLSFSPLSNLWRYLTFSPDDAQASKPSSLKLTLPPIQPGNTLEARRHLLAGRRRAKRIDDAKRGEARDGVSIEVKKEVRDQVLQMEEDRAKGERTSNDDDPQASSREWGERQQRELRALEEEFVVRAWATHEPGIHVAHGMVRVSLPGDAPLEHSEADIRAAARRLDIRLPGDESGQPKGNDVYDDVTGTLAARYDPLYLNRGTIDRRRSLSLHNPTSPEKVPTKSLAEQRQSNSDEPWPSEIPVSATQTTSMRLVFPEHSNSHGIIFGGNTMSWCEEMALLSARHVGKGRGWSTVAMDGLEFGVRVEVGELMVFTAIVIKTYTNSCEVYVLAQAENAKGQRRFTNDVLFTLACSGRQATKSLDDSIKEEEEDNTIKGKETRSNGEGGARREHLPRDDWHVPLSEIKMPNGSALEAFANVADQRRIQRLEMRDMLVRIYGH